MNVPLLPQSAEGRRRLHQITAWCWFTFGIVGLFDYLFGWGLGLASSIPVLFGISVYANFASELSTSGAARTEVKVEETAEVKVGQADNVSVNESSPKRS